MPDRAAAAWLNHLLGAQEWARERLRPFAGRRVEFRAPPFPRLRLAILDSGLLENWTNTADEAAVDLMVTIRPGTLPLLLARQAQAIDELNLAGPPELAAAVRDLCRRLEWDVEEDLAQLFGDALSHRIASAGREIFAWQKDAGLRLAQNLAEYWTEERPLLARTVDVETFVRGVRAASERCGQLERRMTELEAALKPEK